MEKATWMQAPGGHCKPIRGERLREDLKAQGWKEVDAPQKEEKERPQPRYYTPHFNGW